MKYSSVREAGLESSSVQCSTFGDLEYVDCPYCANHDAKILVKTSCPYAPKDIFCLVKCRVCDFIYTNPRPSKSWYSNYLKHCMLKRLGVTGGSYERQVKERSGIYKKILALLKRQGNLRGSRLLDIGCAGGLFVDMAGQEGFEAMGYDHESVGIHNTLKNRKINLFTGNSLEGLGLKEETFGIVAMLDVLEHVSGPLSLLKYVRSLLTPGGILLVITPNFSLYYLQYRLGLKKKRTDDLLAWTHVNFFTPGTVNQFLKKSGIKKLGFTRLIYIRDTIGIRSLKG